jgi:hypothetical protein
VLSLTRVKRVLFAILCFALIGWGSFSLLQTREVKKNYPFQKPYYFPGDPAHIKDGDPLLILRNQNTDLHIVLNGGKNWNPGLPFQIEFVIERRTLGKETIRLPYWKKSLILKAKMLDPDSFVKVIFHIDQKAGVVASLTKACQTALADSLLSLTIGIGKKSTVKQTRCENYPASCINV